MRDNISKKNPTANGVVHFDFAIHEEIDETEAIISKESKNTVKKVGEFSVSRSPVTQFGKSATQEAFYN